MAHVYDSIPTIGLLTAADQHRLRETGIIPLPRYGVMDEYYQSTSYRGTWVRKRRALLQSYPYNHDRNYIEPETLAIMRYNLALQDDEDYLERRRRVAYVANFLHTAPPGAVSRAIERADHVFNIGILYRIIRGMGY